MHTKHAIERPDGASTYSIMRLVKNKCAYPSEKPVDVSPLSIEPETKKDAAPNNYVLLYY